MEKRSLKGQETHLVFIDLEKAYDSVPVQQLWESMERMHVQEPIINLVKRMYQNCKAVVKCGK